MKAPKTGGTRIQSVARASQMLLRVARDESGTTVKDLAADLGLSLPTTYHLINTLLDQGLLTRNQQQRYILGDAVAVLAQSYLRNASASERLLDALRRLAEQTHETVYLADWADAEIRVRGSMEGSRTVRVGGVAGGTYAHAHSRANGKILLAWAPSPVRDEYLLRHPLEKLTPNTITSRRALDAELRRIRERGYAEDREEYSEGVSCLAAPFLLDDVIIAAFGISVPTSRFETNRELLLKTLLDVVATIAPGDADT